MPRDFAALKEDEAIFALGHWLAGSVSNDEARKDRNLMARHAR
jgi:hypothetical protein